MTGQGQGLGRGSRARGGSALTYSGHWAPQQDVLTHRLPLHYVSPSVDPVPSGHSPRVPVPTRLRALPCAFPSTCLQPAPQTLATKLSETTGRPPHCDRHPALRGRMGYRRDLQAQQRQRRTAVTPHCEGVARGPQLCPPDDRGILRLFNPYRGHDSKSPLRFGIRKPVALSPYCLREREAQNQSNQESPLEGETPGIQPIFSCLWVPRPGTPLPLARSLGQGHSFLGFLSCRDLPNMAHGRWKH